MVAGHMQPSAEGQSTPKPQIETGMAISGLSTKCPLLYHGSADCESESFCRHSSPPPCEIRIGQFWNWTPLEKIFVLYKEKKTSTIRRNQLESHSNQAETTVSCVPLSIQTLFTTGANS